MENDKRERLIMAAKPVGKTFAGAVAMGHNLSNKTLTQYALEIREILNVVEDTEKEQFGRRVQIGKLLNELVRLHFPYYYGVQNQTGIPLHERLKCQRDFHDWCKKNILKRNGFPYARGSIHSFMHIGRNPEALRNSIKAAAINSAKHIKQSKRYEKIIEQIPAAECLITRKDAPVHDQVNFLVTAWESASEAARSEFMKLIRLRYL